MYGTFCKKVSYTVLFLNYIFKIQNVNGGIFALLGKNVIIRMNEFVFAIQMNILVWAS